MIDRVCRGLLYIAIVLVAIAYHPLVYLSEALYAICRMGLYGIVGVLAVSKFSGGAFLNCRVLKIGGLIAIALLLQFGFFWGVGVNFEIADATQILMILICCMIGYNMRFESLSGVFNLLGFCAIVGVIVGGLSLNFYKDDIGDFNLYVIEGKNQLGNIVSVSSAIALYLGVEKKARWQWFFFVVFGVGLLSLFYIECRSALVALAVFALAVLFKNLTFYKKILLGILLAGIIFVFADVIVASLVGQHDITDINSLSTGRWERNLMGIEFLRTHWADGELYELSGIPWIHNYLLLRLVRYGVIWAAPFYLFYLYLAGAICRRAFNKERVGICNIGYYVLIIQFVISLLEPSAPFGPGTVVFVSYVILGISARYESSPYCK